MSAVTHVIWDWNGTLLDDVHAGIDVMNVMLAERDAGPPLDFTRYREIFGFPVSDYYLRAGLDLEAEPFEALADRYIELYGEYSSGCALYPGAREVLTRLQRRGMVQLILSASKAEHLHAQMKPFALDGFFSEILGIGDHLAAGKLERGRQWMADSGVNPEAVVLVGDTTHDAEVASALGCRCILIANGHQSRAVLERCRVPVAQDIGEVPFLLEVLSRA